MSITKIRKRDGVLVEFDQTRITQAIFKALTAVNEGDGNLSGKLSDKVVEILNRRFKENEIPTVEQIQDIVEEVLILEGLVETAKAYILYREQRRKIREAITASEEAVERVDQYLEKLDWEVRENANMAFSLQGLNHYGVSYIVKKYWLNKIYPPEIKEAAASGDFHIHNLDTLATYCNGWDLYDLLLRGFGGVKSKIESKPAKYLKSALGQLVNFFYTLQGECYSEDTQVLTASGWKYFYEVSSDDEVFTLNNQTNEITLEKPLRFYKFDYNGELYNFKSKKLDLLVTPNHNMLVDQHCPGCKERYYRRFVKARDFKTGEHYIPKAGGAWRGSKRATYYLSSFERTFPASLVEQEIPRPVQTVLRGAELLLPAIETQQHRGFSNFYEAINIETRKIAMEKWLAFFGFWLTEGLIYKGEKNGQGRVKPSYEYAVRVSQNKTKKLDGFEEVLKGLPFKYNKKDLDKKLEFIIYNKQLFSYLRQFGKPKERFVPQEIKNLPSEQLKILFDWMMRGGGHISKEGKEKYYTNSRKLADDFQEIVLKLGWSADIYENPKGKFRRFKIVISRDRHSKIRKEGVKTVKYSGRVYCLEVPNHTLYVRRNGRACWCGNSAGAQAVSNLDTLLAPFIRYENLNYQEVKQAIEGFLFNCAVPTRVGFQSLAWEEVVVIKHQGKIKFVEIGRLIDGVFEINSHRIIEEHPQSYAVENYDDYYTLSFDSRGRAVWAKVKAFVRHKVPLASQFLRVRTEKGEALVSPAHSLFAFKKFNGEFNPQPVSIPQVEIAPDCRFLNENNHLLALSKFENGELKNELDLAEIIDEYSQLQENVFVKINPTHTISGIKKNILKEYQSLRQFYVDFGVKDKGIWQDCLERKSIRYDIWRKFGNNPKNVWVKLKNSKGWYPLVLRGETLENFVRLCAWYVGEGKKEMSLPVFVFQANPKNKKEILEILKKTSNPGDIQENKGYLVRGNKTKTKKVYKITVKGILAEIISSTCGALSFNKVIPGYIFGLSKNFQQLFIQTLLKGGAQEYEKYWDFSASSRKLSLSLSLLLVQNEIRFNVYSQRRSKKNKKWKDQWIIRVFKKGFLPKKQYRVGDFEARACLKKEEFRYDREFEYDISVDLPQENFIGGTGGLVFHNTPFTNVSLDINPSPSFANQPVIIGGKPQKETYGEFQEEMNIFNKVFYETMMEGDAKGAPFHFPIPTINITKDFPWDNPYLSPLFEASAKYGTSYFANFIQSDMRPEDVRSMCCRLRLSNQELYKRGGGLFGSNPLTGSIGVVTINLPRIGYLSKTKKEFFERLAYVMNLAKESLEIKRKALENFIEKGLYPYSRYYLQGIKKMRGKYYGNHFSTIGLVGMNECLLNFIGENIGSEEGRMFSLEVLGFMREELVKYQEETGNLYNLEQTPAESTSYRLAQKDKEKFPDIITAGTEEVPFYTNSSQLPVNYTDDIFEALTLQDEIQCQYTGGSVLHLFLGEQISDINTVKKLLKKIFESFRLPYITFTPTFSVCPTHGYLAGEHFECPKCTIKQPCEVYSRIVGYLRPVSQWNKGKQEEFKERKEFVIPRINP